MKTETTAMDFKMIFVGCIIVGFFIEYIRTAF